MQLSIQVLVPKDLEKKASKWIEAAHEDLAEAFKKFIKKEREKVEE